MNFNSVAPIFEGIKVLIATITSDAKKYCQEDFLNNLKLLDYKPADFIIIDNSETVKNSIAIEKHGFKTFWLPRKGKTSEKMMYESEAFLREKFLKGGYHFLMRIESDLFPPQDIVQRLMMHRSRTDNGILPIVSAAYFITNDGKDHLMMQDIEEQGTGSKELMMCNVTDMHDMVRMTGGLVKTASCGMGCMLTAKEVEENIQLTYDDRMYPDAQWHHHANQLGYNKFIDTSVLVEHQNRAWEHE